MVKKRVVNTYGKERGWEYGKERVVNMVKGLGIW